jgi:hypothetical protein
LPTASGKKLLQKFGGNLEPTQKFSHLGWIWRKWGKLGEKCPIPWNPEKFGAIVYESREELISDISVVVDACI